MALPSLACVFLLAAGTLPGAQAPAGSTDRPATAEAVDHGPIAVPRPTPVAVRYHRSGNVLWLASTLWGIAVLGALLVSGFSARLRDLASRIGRRWFFAVAAYGALFSLAQGLGDLPLDFSGYLHARAYGLSNQAPGAWFRDHLVALGVRGGALALTLWIPYALLRESPRRWWLYTSLAAVPLTALMLVVFPVWIAPLFDDFRPMQHRSLEARILDLADRAGVEGGRVYEVDKSEDTRAINAYVAGLGPSQRIVLWDTALEAMDEREILFLMGHELGHYVLRHAYGSLALSLLLIVSSLYATHRTSGWLISRLGHRFRFGHLGDVASLPLLLLVVGVTRLAVTPVIVSVSRHMEHEADRFGLEITRDNAAAARAFIHMQSRNLGVPYPGPIYRHWRQSHPSLGDRIEFANGYRPWERGEPLRYQGRFRQE